MVYLIKMGEKTPVKVDKKLVKEAHKVGLNVSKICENALKDAIRRLKGSTNPGSLDKSISSSSLDIFNAGVAKLGKASDLRFDIQGLSNDEILSKFKEFCEIDLQLMKRTVKEHVWQVRRFFKALNKAPDEINDQDIREYLTPFKEKSPATYANVLISLRRFFRDFIGKKEVIESFRLPDGPPIRPKIVPKKEQLQQFYGVLKTPQERAIFLMFATTGLRKHELLSVRLEDIDFERRMIIPQDRGNRTKRTWVTFFNDEAGQALRKHIATSDRLTPESRLFSSEKTVRTTFEKAYKKTGIHITPQVLREWFACEMGRLGVGDRYIDAFCGRVPSSVLARHYTDFSPERLKEIYDKAGLKVLS